MATKKVRQTLPTLDDLVNSGYRYQPPAAVEIEPAPEPAKRNGFAVVNDTVIEVANAAAGGAGAIADFVSPGNRFSAGVDQFVRSGEESQSDLVKSEKAKFREDLAGSETVGSDVEAVGRYVVRNPLLTMGQAAGSFALPGGAVKTAGGLVRGLGAGARGASMAGRAAGIGTGAAMGGGDAAGSAYDLVMNTPDEVLAQNPQVAELLKSMPMSQAREVVATAAARQASVLPALAGGAAGAFGAEKLLAGAGMARGGMRGALGVGAAEGATEAVEEGLTQYEGQRAAQAYNPAIDPTKNVAAMATMGGIMGFGTGAGLAAVSPGDAIRAEKLPESGPMTRAANAGMEFAAGQADAGIMPTAPVDPAAEAQAAQQEKQQQDEAAKSAPIFNVRLNDVRATLAEPGTMDAVRARFGDDGTTQLLNSLTQAQNPKIPASVRDKHFQAVEEAMFVLNAQRLPDAPQGLGMDRPELLERAPAPLAIELDTSPTGTMRVDGAGNVAPETRADAISTRSAVDEQLSLGKSAPRGADREVPAPTPALQVVAPEAQQDEAARPEVAAVGAEPAPAAAPTAPAPAGEFASAADAEAYIRQQRRDASIRLPEALPLQREDGRFGVATADQAEFATAQAQDKQRRDEAAGIRPGDRLNKLGEPFRNKAAAVRSAKKDGGNVVPVSGGFVVRLPEAPAIEGAAIDKEWTAFAPESGTLGRPRSEMPQIKAEHRGAMVNFLAARGITHESIEIPAAELKPTQAEFSPARVAKAMEFKGGDRSILVSADGHVLDGHHQWKAKRDANEPVKAIRLNAPIEQLLATVKEFPSAGAADGAAIVPPKGEDGPTSSAPVAASDTAAEEAGSKPDQEPAQEKPEDEQNPSAGAEPEASEAPADPGSPAAAGSDAPPAGPAAAGPADPEAAGVGKRTAESRGLPVEDDPAYTESDEDPTAQAGRTGAEESGSLDPLRRPSGAVQRRARVIGLGIAADIQRTGSSALVGREVTSPDHLAELAQVYRDPRYETFRVFFTKGNEIVHATGISARMPGFAPMVPNGMTAQEYFQTFRDAMAKTGADGYYLLHNHPSGNPEPSNADLSVTENLAAMVPGLRAHVVINSNRYAVIDGRNNRPRVETKDFGPDVLLTAGKPSAYLGRSIDGVKELVSIGKSLQRPGWITLVGTDARNAVRVVAEAPSSILARNYPYLAGTVRRLMRQSGSTSVSAVGSSADISSKPVKVAVARGVLRDAVGQSDSTLRQQGLGGGDQEFSATRARYVAEGGGYSTAGRTAAGGRAADVRSLANAIASRWKNAPEVVVVENMQDEAVPQAVRDHDTEQRSQGASGDPEGFFYRGRVYLVADQLGGDADVVRVLFHEALGHAGLRGTFGTELGTILDRLAVLNQAKVRAKAKQYGLNYDTPADRRAAAEEVLAEMAQSNPHIGWVRRAVAAIRSFLRAHVPGFAKMKFSDAEIVQSFLLPARQFVQRGRGPATGSAAFSRTDPEAAALKALSENDELFALPKSTQTTLEGIVADNDPQITVKKTDLPGSETMYTLTMPNGAQAYLTVRKPNPYGPSLYGYNQVDGEIKDQVTERPGENPEDVDPDKEDVWIDVSRLKQGGDGTVVYNIAATFAHNTGRMFIGDPAGLSDAAMRRRSEQMLSSALKFGTTEHLAPHLRQVQGDRKLGVPPLKWVYGDHLANIRALIDVNLAALENAGADIATFDPSSGQFFDANNQAISRDGLARQSQTKDLGDRGIAGGRTIARGAVLKSLLRQEGQEARGADGRPAGVLDRLVRVASDSPAATDEIFYSRSGSLSGLAESVRDFDQTAARNLFLDAVTGQGNLNAWHKTVGTQYHKAQQNPDTFGRVFNRVQDYIKDISVFANSAADNAPTILPKLDTWRDVAKGGLLRHGADAKDLKAAGDAIFQGTLAYTRDTRGRLILAEDARLASESLSIEEKAQELFKAGKLTEQVLKMWKGLPQDQFEKLIQGKFEREMLSAGTAFTDAELRSVFKLSDSQVALYREFRGAVDQSLDDTVKSEMVRVAGQDGEAVRDQVMAAFDAGAATKVFLDHFATLAEAAPDRKAGLDETYNLIADKAAKVEKLKADGYAPLMRFGRFTVTAMGADGVQFFSMFESRIAANRAARQLREDPDFADAEITTGLMSQEQHKLFAGMPIDALELFADVTGNADNQAYQDYLKLTKANRSALKRMIHRKGIAGYSDDVGRVLASFVTSNARLAAGNLHLGAAKQAAQDIPKEQGDLKDEAVRLVEYVQNPQEEAAAMRNLLFVNFIGGSVASAAVNLTQPLTMTLPYLSQFGGVAKAGRRILSATKAAAGGTVGGEIGAALKRAEAGGIVAPQEIHHLQAEAMAKVSHPALKKAAFIWGSMFSLAEQFNRRVSFIAGYQTALDQGIPNPYDFAEKAVIETQGLYNKGNKANWARGAVGATAMTFKQFSTHYLEFLVRMHKSGPAGKRATAVALAILMLTAGAGGLPFADDLDDLIDTLAQAMGYDFSAKRAKRKFIADTLGLGPVAAEVATRGLSSLPGMPLDVSLRMGLGNLLPGTGILLRSNTDRSRDLLEVAGAAGGLAQNVMEGASNLLKGEVLDAGKSVAPLAIQNIMKGLQMATTGEYRDTNGRKVQDVGGVDSALKGIGFQPATVARESSRMGESQRSVQLARNVESEIAGRWAQALADGDQAGVLDAREELANWNRKNPGTPIGITMPQILKRVRQLKTSRAERTVKAAPKELRGLVAETLN